MTLPIVKGSANFCGNFDVPEIISANFALKLIIFCFLGRYIQRYSSFKIFCDSSSTSDRAHANKKAHKLNKI
jgi:hypothetical protein